MRTARWDAFKPPAGGSPDMALKRYIGRISPAKVRLDGEDYDLIETGEKLAVPDELAARLSWPAANWEDAETTAKEAEK